MPKLILEISDFAQGIIDDPTIASRNGFQDMVGVEFRNPDGVLKIDAALTNADSGSPVLGLVTAFEETNVDTTNKLYGVFSDGTDTKIITSTGGAFSSAHSDTTNTPVPVPGMVTFAGNLYWGTKESLGKFDGTTWTDAFKTFTGQDTKFKILKEFAGSLWIGDGRYIAQLESDGTTFNATALTLPAEYRVRCLEVFSDFLVIGTEHAESSDTDFTQSNPAFSKVFLWDGVSSKANFIIDVATIGGILALRNLNNQLYMLVRKSTPPNPSGLFLMRYNGSDFDVIRHIDNVDHVSDMVHAYPEALSIFNENLVISPSVSGSPNGTIRNGIWEFNPKNRALRRLQPLTPTITNFFLEVGAIFPSFKDRKLIASWNNNTLYGVDRTNSGVFTTDAYIETQKYEVGEDFGRLIKGVKIFARPIPANGSVQIQYKIDDETSWVTLGTITSSNQDDILYGIYKRAKHTIQLKVILKNSDSTANPEITKIAIY